MCLQPQTMLSSGMVVFLLLHMMYFPMIRSLYVPTLLFFIRRSDAFTGIVSEVVSGDILVIKDTGSAVDRRICLSSIRAPRLGARDRASEPWGTEAKEFLRQRLIGKEVNVRMEYDRKIPAPVGGEHAGGDHGKERIMAFGTVTVQEKADGGEVKLNNVAELLLVRGLAQVVKHRPDEERSGKFFLCDIFLRFYFRNKKYGRSVTKKLFTTFSLYLQLIMKP